MGLGSQFQKYIMKPSRKIGRQLEDWTKTTYMGDTNGIEGLRQKQQQQSGTDLGKLRRDAIANGFNPLTVLRATGGQGFYKNEIPMGRLSSDAFFNTFDRIKQRNYNKLPVMEQPKIEIDTDNYFNGGVKIPEFKINETPVQQSPLRFDVVNINGKHVSSDAKALKSQWVREDGQVVTIFGESTDISEMSGAYAVDKYYKFHKLFPNFNVDNLRSKLKNSGENTAIRIDKLKADGTIDNSRVNFVKNIHGALSKAGDFFTRNQGIPIEDALSPDTIPNWYNRRK